jgi:hypothetical protein
MRQNSVPERICPGLTVDSLQISITSGALNCSTGRRGALCATVFYRKRINGRLYSKAARTGPYAFAEEVRCFIGNK